MDHIVFSELGDFERYHYGSQDCSNCIGIPSNIFLCHSRRMVLPGRIHEWFQFVGASLRNESDWKALSEALFLPEWRVPCHATRHATRWWRNAENIPWVTVHVHGVAVCWSLISRIYLYQAWLWIPWMLFGACVAGWYGDTMTISPFFASWSSVNWSCDSLVVLG